MIRQVWGGDCLALLAAIRGDSVPAIVCDPPYALTNRTPDVMRCENCGRVLGGVDGKPETCPKCGGALSRQRSRQGAGFMGKKWDAAIPSTELWAKVLRVARPGAHLLAFGGTRTFHRLACAIEDAGWEIRDTLMWLYGSGFPKSLDVSKALDKQAGAERENTGRVLSVTGNRVNGSSAMRPSGLGAIDAGPQEHIETIPATDLAKRWDGWGTALKPGWEPIVMARKPLAGTVAQNVAQHGTGAINVDGCRIDGPKGTGVWGSSNRTCQEGRTFNASPTGKDYRSEQNLAGRWPANVVLSHTPECDGACAEDCPVRMLDEQSGERPGMASQVDTKETPSAYFGLHKEPGVRNGRGDTGGASRFYYCAKASRSERNAGCEHLAPRKVHPEEPNGNFHPTVKPINLMRWLCRLVTPLGGWVLDPFSGSASTGCAAMLEGFGFLGFESEAEYLPIARARLDHWGRVAERLRRMQARQLSFL